MKKNYWGRLLLGLFISLILLSNLTGWTNITFISQLDNIIYDTRLNFSLDNKPQNNEIIILDVDEKSLAIPELGRWPWNRSKMASIMDTLFEHYQIKQLGFDVIWAESDQSSGFKVLQELAKTDLKEYPSFSSSVEKLRPALDFDNKFAKSILDRPVVLGYYFNTNNNATKVGELPIPLFSKEDLTRINQNFPLSQGYSSNLSMFVNATPLAGHFNPTVDFDGVIRRVPLLAAYENEYYESLALAMFRLSLAIDRSDKKTLGQLPDQIPGAKLMTNAPNSKSVSLDSYDIEGIQIGDKILPTDAQTNLLVPYQGRQRSFRYVSLSDIYFKNIPVEDLKNKIVLVGTSAPGLSDLRTTPVGALYPGVEVHASILAGLLDPKQNSIKQTPLNIFVLEILIILCVGVLLSFLFSILPTHYAVSLFGVILISSIIGNYTLWQAGYAIPLASLLLLISSIYIANIAYAHFIESRNKRELKELFGQYVPPELVDKMAENPLKYNMSARKENLSVLFSDIVGFSSISEHLTPLELTEFVNGYLTEMSLIIRNNRGTLDKYIGDAIMAFWGAPIEDQRHAHHAVLTALLMKDKIQGLNSLYQSKNWPGIKIGIGVSTGEMTVGDMGSNIRRAYTVMSDNVNLGSRLEGATRFYKVGILVSESTKNETPEIVYRSIDIVRVKGKKIPVKIFEPINLASKVSVPELEIITKWNNVFALFQDKKLDLAQEHLNELIRLVPDDALYQIYQERITVFKRNPPPDDWDGVYQFETK